MFGRLVRVLHWVQHGHIMKHGHKVKASTFLELSLHVVSPMFPDYTMCWVKENMSGMSLLFPRMRPMPILAYTCQTFVLKSLASWVPDINFLGPYWSRVRTSTESPKISARAPFKVHLLIRAQRASGQRPWGIASRRRCTHIIQYDPVIRHIWEIPRIYKKNIHMEKNKSSNQRGFVQAVHVGYQTA